MDYFFLIILSFSLNIILYYFGKKINLVDVPTQRKIHDFNTPLIGGISITVVYLLSILCLVILMMILLKFIT